MELTLQILMLFIGINAVLKLSFWKWWQTTLFGLAGALFTVATSPLAAQQSKTQLADYLADGATLQNAAVLITLESVLCIAFCFTALGAMHSGQRKLRTKLLGWYPGLLLFPVLFYLQTQTIYALPGSDFTAISYALAGGAFVLIPLLSAGVRYLCPERELRLEVHFLTSLFVCIIGLITTVNGNVAYAAVKEPANLRAILLSAGLFLFLFFSGVLWNKLKWKIRHKKTL